jgi:hypothetical protein
MHETNQATALELLATSLGTPYTKSTPSIPTGNTSAWFARRRRQTPSSEHFPPSKLLLETLTRLSYWKKRLPKPMSFSVSQHLGHGGDVYSSWPSDRRERH